LPKEAQIDNELMSEMKGIPWQPGDGVRHKVTREVSQPAIIPAPAAAGNAASAEGINESHPTLAEDGEKVDEEGAAVVAAAQLEELIGPMEEEGEHFSAGATAEDDMVDSLLLRLLRRLQQQSRAGNLRPSAVRVGHQVCKAFRTSRQVPVAEGGKHEREPSAQLTPGEAEPKQSRQAGIMGHLTNREIWEKIQDRGNAEEESNLTAIQRISNVTDFVDQLLDPQEVEKTPSCGQEALSRQSTKRKFRLVLKCFPKWVDKCSKGAHKSRFTCADVKARYSAEEEEGLDVFVPTPTLESHNRLEVYALQNGFYTRSLDIVAAFLIGKDRGATEGKPVSCNCRAA
jgi:hypothetical protein